MERENGIGPREPSDGEEPADPGEGGGWVAPGGTAAGPRPEDGPPRWPSAGEPEPASGAPENGAEDDTGAPRSGSPVTESASEAPRDWWGTGGGAPVFGAENARRLSPRSLVVGPINQLRSLLVPIAAGLIVGGFNPWVLTATGVAVVGLLVGGFVTWRTFRYEIGEERLEIRSGLIRRSTRTIPLERIRGVDVTSTLLHRMLGVAVVRIEAAAGSPGGGEEGKLDAVSVAEAERLRRVLLHRKAVLLERHREETEPVAGEEGRALEPAQALETVPEPEDTGTTYFRMPWSWYLYGALALGYLLTPFAVLATLFGMAQQAVGDRAADFLVDWVTTSDRGFLLVFAVVFAGALILLMPVFAVVSYSLTHWGFSLRGRDGSLIAERGLFTRRSVTLERRRVRGYELLDNPLERTRRAVSLRAIVTGLGDTANRAVLLPIGPRPRVEEVVDRALGLFRGRLTPHPRAALYRRLTRAVLPFAVVAVAAIALEPVWPSVVAGVLALLGVPLGVDRYRSLGHGYDGELVSVRSGSLRRTQATVERSAVIGWSWTQSPFQRRSGLVDLELAVGAGEGGYTAQDAAQEESVDFAARITPEMVRPFLVREDGEPPR